MISPTNSTPTTSLHKTYGITNIKTYIPLILGLVTQTYDPCSDLFKVHCNAFDVLDHIDTSFVPLNKLLIDPEQKNLDFMVKLWLFGSISQSLITSTSLTQAIARKVWLNLHTLFCKNKETTIFQLDNELQNISMDNITAHDKHNISQ